MLICFSKCSVNWIIKPYFRNLSPPRINGRVFFAFVYSIHYRETTMRQCHFIVLPYQSRKIIISQLKWFECSIQFCIKIQYKRKLSLWTNGCMKKVTQSCALELSTFFRHRLMQSLLNKDKNIFSTESFQHQSTGFIAMLLTNATPVPQWAVCVGCFASYETQARLVPV